MSSGGSSNCSGIISCCVCVCVFDGNEGNNETNNKSNSNNGNHKNKLSYCFSCVENRLSSLRKRRMEVIKRHEAARNAVLLVSRRRNKVHEEVKNNSDNYENSDSRWRDAVSVLKSENEELAIRHLLPLQCSNEERENNISKMQGRLNRAQSGYHGLEEAVIGSIQEDIIQRMKSRKLNLQYQLCCRIWQMHRVTLVRSNNNNNNNNNNNSRNNSSGYGKIGGLPLPHAGPSLYGALPSNLVSSSLYLLASLTRFMSQALDIPLVHPILFQIVGSSHPPSFSSTNMDPNNGMLCTLKQLQSLQLEQDAAAAVTLDDPPSESDDTVNTQKRHPHSNHHSIGVEKQHTSSSSYLPIASELLSTSSSYLVSSAISAMKKTYWKTSTAYHSNNNNNNNNNNHNNRNNNHMKKGNIDYFNQMKRNGKKKNVASSSIFRVVLNGTCCAVLCEKPFTQANNNLNNMEYKLQPPNNNTNKNQGEEFSIALQLLQNNIVALCIRAGVPVQSLYPAEAMLLNLHALVLYCQKEQQKQQY